MAVFTEVPEDEARALLRSLNLGDLRGLRGIQGGIENTNYFVTAHQDGGGRHQSAAQHAIEFRNAGRSARRRLRAAGEADKGD